MRMIIAGSRDFVNYFMFKKLIQGHKDKITTVISGGAEGADSMGEQFARENGIPFEVYPADWDKYGRSAGSIRNELMASKAEGLIAFWDGQSRGTKHMIDTAKKKNLYVKIFML